MNEQSEGQLFHVTDVGNLPSILRDGLKAHAGSWLGVAWKPRIFFTRTRLSAYEIASMFVWERKGDYVLIVVDRNKIRRKLRPDRDFDQGVWVAADVSADAIIEVKEIDDDVFESPEFRRHMGYEDDEELIAA